MPQARSSGFTLLEILVVLTIMGILLGVVSVKALPSEKQNLQEEVRRLALLMAVARDEAILVNKAIALDVDNEGYRFLRRDEGEWQPFKGDEQLRERSFAQAPVSVSQDPPAPLSGPIRMVFGREPVGSSFTLSFKVNESTVLLKADGVGNFSVE
jgi:general secretion pathway protein H